MVGEGSVIRDVRYDEAYRCIQAAGASGLAMKELADCLHLSVTPYLYTLTDQMAAAGWIVKKQSVVKTGRGYRMGWLMFLPSEG